MQYLLFQCPVKTTKARRPCSMAVAACWSPMTGLIRTSSRKDSRQSIQKAQSRHIRPTDISDPFSLRHDKMQLIAHKPTLIAMQEPPSQRKLIIRHREVEVAPSPLQEAYRMRLETPASLETENQSQVQRAERQQGCCRGCAAPVGDIAGRNLVVDLDVRSGVLDDQPCL